MILLLAALAAYLLGSIPFSFLIGKLGYGIDIREHGSGNVGATNLGRACGVRAGVLGLLFDAAKGAAAVLAAGSISGALARGDRLVLLGLGCCAMIGHMAPIFLAGNGGGKGVATGAGVFLAIDPRALGLALCVFVVTVLVSRYVSLGSCVAAVALPILLLARDRQPADPVFLLSILVALAIVYKHRANLARIRAGTESKLPLGKRRGPPATDVDVGSGSGPAGGAGPGTSPGQGPRQGT
ncbi:MAG: glycerol-3-phosphate 1-O-acyltransferase PlsY [Candidatus Wallbacteria bacterium]|nr:glycerol-3-phosphate 1-O-acyltransferase PlsY [Candidatus Wallbacteria bacterium]